MPHLQRKFTLKHSMLRHRKKHDSGVSSGGDASDDTDSEVGGAPSTYTSSVEGRSSPEDGDDKVGSTQRATADKNATVTSSSMVKKKRANLMDKINQLSSSVNGQTASSTTNSKEKEDL